MAYDNEVYYKRFPIVHGVCRFSISFTGTKKIIILWSIEENFLQCIRIIFYYFKHNEIDKYD